MKSLWEISADMAALDELLFELDGELTDEQMETAIDAWFQENADNLAEKLDGYCAVIAEREALADLRVKEGRRLIALANVDLHKTNALRLRLKAFFESRGTMKFETLRHKFTIAKNGGPVPLTINPAWSLDPAAAPERFHKIKIELDKDAIRAALQSSESIDGCEFTERGKHLLIK